jgi:hypothetical protein
MQDTLPFWCIFKRHQRIFEAAFDAFLILEQSISPLSAPSFDWIILRYTSSLPEPC